VSIPVVQTSKRLVEADDVVWADSDSVCNPDPNLVIVASTFDSQQTAEALMNNATLREAMARGGVIESSVQIDYVDEVDAGAR
jgi:hypothetical protein